ncbi:uncharacterized protein LOC134242367 [Saccostrea cucullata]|uniref:uncharacterized protein LOC134242367 n=1 Tax=Saccostrea cuccullata TaxID=36930 RepID=UPI002ED19388
MEYFLLVSLAIMSGILSQKCSFSGLEDCVSQPSILNYTQKISSLDFIETLNPQKAVDEHCSIQWKLVSCFQDVKRCYPSKGLSLASDLVTSAVKYLCTEGKPGFIDNFHCMMTNFAGDHNNLQSCKKFYPELIKASKRKAGSDASSEECIVLKKVLACIEDRAQTLCGGKAATYIRSYLEASMKPLTKGITCNNGQTTITHRGTFFMIFVAFSICLFNFLYDF